MYPKAWEIKGHLVCSMCVEGVLRIQNRGRCGINPILIDMTDAAGRRRSSRKSAAHFELASWWEASLQGPAANRLLQNQPVKRCCCSISLTLGATTETVILRRWRPRPPGQRAPGLVSSMWGLPPCKICLEYICIHI